VPAGEATQRAVQENDRRGCLLAARHAPAALCCRGFVRGASVPPVKLRQHNTLPAAVCSLGKKRTETKILRPVLKNFIRILLLIGE